MFKILLLLAIVLSLFVENTLVAIPLVIFFSILFYIVEPTVLSVIFIFFIGLICDVLKINQIGMTSLFLMLVVGFIYLYRNTFELTDLKITIIFPFIFSYIYAILFSYNANIFLYLFLLVISEGIVYYFTRKTKPLVADF